MDDEKQKTKNHRILFFVHKLTVKKKPRYQIALIVIPAVAMLAGCLATTGGYSPAENKPHVRTNPAVPEKFTVGGNLPLQQTSKLTNPVFSTLPPVTSSKDYQALLNLSKKLALEAKKHADAGRTQEFIETWYVAQQFLAYAQQIKGSTELFVDSLHDDGTGKLVGRLPAMTTAVIPIDQAIGEINIVLPPDTKGTTSTGPLINKPFTIGDAIRMATGSKNNGEGGSAPASTRGLPTLYELPERTPVTAPNGIQLYRNGDILTVSNPTREPLDLPLSDAGWVVPADVLREDAKPPKPKNTPAVTQKNPSEPEVARLKITMSRYLQTWFWSKLQSDTSISTIECRMYTPGVAKCSDGDQLPFDLKGQLTRDNTAVAAAQRSYTVEPRGAFRLAVDFLKKDTQPYLDFKRRCSPQEFSKSLSSPVFAAIDEVVSGSQAELQTVSCRVALRQGGQNGAFKVVHSQTFYLQNGQFLLTEATLRANTLLDRRLMKAVEQNKIAQDVVALIPALSNIENAAKCYGGPEWSPTVFLIESYQSMTLQKAALDRLAASAFLPLSIPLSQEPQAVDRAMSCIGAITPGAWGKIGKATLNTAKAAYLGASARLAEAAIKKPSKVGAMAGNLLKVSKTVTLYQDAKKYADDEKPINPDDVPYSKLSEYY